MEYMQQKTPYIEKWEKEMEELLFSTNFPKNDIDYLFPSPVLTGKQTGEEKAFMLQSANETALLPTFNPDLAIQAINGNVDPAILTKNAALFPPPISSKKRKSEVSVAPTALLSQVPIQHPETPVTSQQNASEQATVANRKANHNSTEKKRRDNINGRLNELKQMIPTCRNIAIDKAGVLQQALEYIKQLQRSNSELIETNNRLNQTNEQLNSELMEITRSVFPLMKAELLSQQGTVADTIVTPEPESPATESASATSL